MQDLKNVSVGNKASFAMESNSVDGGGTLFAALLSGSIGPIGPILDDGTEVWVCCVMLCSQIHFLPTFWLKKVTIIYLA